MNSPIKTITISNDVDRMHGFAVIREDGTTDETDEGLPDTMRVNEMPWMFALKIDVATGQILNWKAPSQEDLEELLNPED